MGTPTLGAALKRRRLRLICIVIRAFSFESTAHWNIMACLLRTLNCAYAGSTVFCFSTSHLHIQTVESLPLLLKRKYFCKDDLGDAFSPVLLCFSTQTRLFYVPSPPNVPFLKHLLCFRSSYLVLMAASHCPPVLSSFICLRCIAHLPSSYQPAPSESWRGTAHSFNPLHAAASSPLPARTKLPGNAGSCRMLH